MRWITMLILGGVLALSGCGDDSSGSSGTGGSGGGGSGSAAPTITMIAWETTPTCDGATDYMVTITATDPDTDEADLIYDGSVSGCTPGAIDAMVSTINCPNVAPYPGTAMVTDPDGNASTPVAFDIGVCETSSCTTDPDTCTR